MKRRNLKAFSIIEISEAILVIGILVAGFTKASRLVGESSLRMARNLTTSSRVASLDVWYFGMNHFRKRFFNYRSC